MSIRLKGKYLKPLEHYILSPANYSVEGGCSYNDNLDEVAYGIAEVYKGCMSPNGAYRILIDAIFKIDDRIRAEREAGVEHDDYTVRTRVISNVVETFATYPRDYELTVYLTGYKLFTPLTSELIEGFEFHGDNRFRDALSSGTFIKLKVSGHCDPSVGSESVTMAFSRLKAFAFFLTVHKLCLTGYFFKSADAAIKDLYTGETAEIYIPRDLSLLLGGLRLHVPTLFQGIGRVDAQQLGLQFQARLSSIGSQMSTLMNPENESIATAVEWLMDSVYMENQTVSFLAVCIGLESILGDQDHHMNDMTSRLCDRLGYLLGKDRSERIKLSSEYRKVLDLRGRLVHSKRSRLSDSDKHVLDSAKSLLERSILRELELASA